ncbi:hypothetical protein SCB49_02629 [unidentified eubacterium SCB49]|nr:hypothetical protein SCB49_02629 [unidentified eubacterium SCB49]
MKHLFIILCLSFVFISCSSDSEPEEQDSEIFGLILKTLTEYRYPDNDFVLTYTESYNEDVQLIHKDWGQGSSYYKVNYNPSGYINEAKLYNPDNSITRTISYFYNASNGKIDSIGHKSTNLEFTEYDKFTHEENKISLLSHIDYYSDEFTFNEKGKIIYLDKRVKFSSFYTTFEYELDNVKKLNITYSSGNSNVVTIEYEYDSFINPLYRNTEADYLNDTVLDYRQPGYKELNFSKNNFITKTYTSSLYPEDNYVYTREIEYNSDNYPITSINKSNGEIVGKHTYEYH